MELAPAGRRVGALGGSRDHLARNRPPHTQKNELKPWRQEQWCLAPTADPAFVWHMEDVLSVYARPYDSVRPVICLDETSRQLLADVRPSHPPAPGLPARQDPEYVRGGVANVFLVTVPLRSWRDVLVGEQRTRLDWARCVKHLADVRYPAAEAKSLADRLEIHYTPKHGSWLNMAELDLSVLQRQCLSQRLPDRTAMHRAVCAWAARRNAAVSAIAWPFTNADARTKLKRLYPTFEM